MSTGMEWARKIPWPGWRKWWWLFLGVPKVRHGHFWNRSNLRGQTSSASLQIFGATCIAFFLHKLEHVMSLFPQSSISKQYCRRGYRFDKMILVWSLEETVHWSSTFQKHVCRHFVICVFVGCHNIFFQHLLLSKSVVILVIRVLILTRVSKTLKKFVYLDSICLQSKKNKHLTSSITDRS